MSASDRRDDDELRVLVELAAAGELSDAEVAEVEALIANRPDLVAAYERLRTPPPAAPAPPGQSRRSGGGCLLPIIAAVVAGAIVLALAIAIRGGGGDDGEPLSRVDAVIEDPDQVSLELDGPPELTNFGRLALIYSPDEGRAVLLGTAIEVGGVLSSIDGTEQTVLASFDAGDVEILIDEIDPDATFTVTPDE